ncbi:DUF2946 family protein [Halomonas litopenaei]|uniref:DUF2946 family protein n=1 Tax=Halomonas litopenaei TaxID=2109328 RepID=UPI003FA0C35C
MPSAARLLGPSSSSRRQRRVCLLAVLAMLMLFVGPLISQVQRLAMEHDAEAGRQHHHGHGHHQGQAPGPGQRPAQGPGQDLAQGTGHGHAQHDPTPSAAEVEGHSTSEPPEKVTIGDAGHHHLAACGYCVLFAQVPWLALLLLVLTSQAPRAPPARRAAGIAPVASGRFQRPTPRAPPASFS